MADACNPADLPPGMDLYASYVDGKCATNRGDPVRISSLATDAGNVGDCEPENPPPASWVIWVQRRRAAGVDPAIYCADDSLSDFFAGYRWRDVRQAFQAARVPEPHYWITKPGATSIPAGAVAVQVGLNIAPGWDLSLVADYWPGVDNKEIDMILVTDPGGAGHILFSDGTLLELGLDSATTAAQFQTAGLGSTGQLDADTWAKLVANDQARRARVAGSFTISGTGTLI